MAIVTCSELPEPDVDEQLLMDALARAGVDASLQPWDDASIDWSAFQSSIIRSTWNYPEFPDSFRTWIKGVSSQTRLYNPPLALDWNIHKRYLLELEQRGVPIVPTQMFDQGQTVSSEQLKWNDVVVKPAISAGSWLTERFSLGQEVDALEFLNGELQNCDMMVQPYLDSVENGGEVAWVWIDGQVTHGVSKAPRFHEGVESVSEGIPVSTEAGKLVETILEAAGFDLLYARVDVMRSGDEWLLSELEIIEPSLFFRQNSGALDRFVDALKGLA